MANYLKQGTNDNFIIDSAEIELAKFNNLRFSVLGYMLGDFDERGVYTVDEEIVKELIAMRKYIVSTIDNVEICHSEIRLNRPITFLVTFEEDCATLSLIEKISHEGNYKENGGSVSDINEYVLDRVETSGVINRAAVYRRWHIGEFAGNARDIASLDDETKAEFFGIINRFKYLLYTNTLMLEKEEEIEEQEVNYAEEMKKLLARFPKLKAAVEKNVKEKLTEKKDFVRIDKPFVARTINEIVEQAIAENISVLKPKELEEFKAEKHEILNQHNQRMAQIVQAKVEKPAQNAENSVGKVLVDTGVMPVAVLPKAPTETAQQAGVPTLAAEHPEKRHTIEELRKGLNTQRARTENRLIDEAISAITGQAPVVEEGTEKQPKAKRITAVVDHEMNTHVSPTTKRDAEEGKTRKPVVKPTTDDANKGLIAKATEKPKTATATPKTEQKPAAKSTTGSKSTSSNKKAPAKAAKGGGATDESTGKKQTQAKNNNGEHTTKVPKKIPRVDPRLNGNVNRARPANDEDNKTKNPPVVEEKPPVEEPKTKKKQKPNLVELAKGMKKREAELKESGEEVSLPTVEEARVPLELSETEEPIGVKDSKKSGGKGVPVVGAGDYAVAFGPDGTPVVPVEYTLDFLNNEDKRVIPVDKYTNTDGSGIGF